MSFQTYLENLRAKPEHIRKRYAFWTSFGVTAVIFAFWLGSFTPLGAGAGAQKNAILAAVDRAGTPSQSMVAAVGSFFGDIRDIFFGPRKVTFSTIEIAPGKK
ncbi:MAG: hypothetical protein KGI45_02275 [Patescibacteria group bacterium]|nr:hypothetical protein [Patescibacteria group bacterium]MDE1941183.1 hypothetical protein [Patescibacteria group bacterium]MDE1966878.1 hypothetical protein [Patescibacteria group bacterium]